MPVYKDKKRNTWYFRIYTTNKMGIKKQITRSGFSTKSDAKLQEQRFISNTDDNLNSNIKFKDLYEDYKKFKYQRIKQSSFNTITNKIELYILPYFGDFILNKITFYDYVNWKSLILNHNFSFKYNSSLHQCMVNILKFANENYGLEKNVAIKVGNFKNTNVIKKYNFWTYDEFYIFINQINEIEYKTLFRFLFFTGARLGECLALTWNDFINNYIDINKTLSQKSKDKNHNYIITTPKTFSSIRKIELDKETINQLNYLKEYYETFIGFNNDWFIFGGIKPLSTTTIERKKNLYCDKANIKRIRIHDFRHSHATMLIANKLPIPNVSERLGHADKSMTLKIYSHVIPKDEEKIIGFINDIEERNYNGNHN